MIKRILLGVLGIVLLAGSVIVFNTLTFTSKQQKGEATPAPRATPAALQHFQEAIRIKTISFGDSTQFDSSQFNAFHHFLRQAYPRVHEKLTVEKINGYSLLYKWEGKNSSLKPFILMAHQDVVPIEEASKNLWTVDPFGGEIKENFIWGRGTVDDKINLISILEACDKLLSENFQPERTIYFAFGHDEERGGSGAQAIADWFKSKNILAELILDEGGMVTDDKIPGLHKPVALIGNAEKGFLSVELTVEKSGGHSSMPEQETAIDILTKALLKLRENPFEARFSEPMEGFMQKLGPEMEFQQKVAFANRWLFSGMIKDIYAKTGPGNAMIRTTLVPTIIQAGVKDNVIPTVARAVVNLRLLPGDESTDVIARMNKIVNDSRIKISPISTPSEASPVTSIESNGYKKIETVIKQTFPEVLTSPFLVIGATDSRHLAGVSTDILKFSPMIDPVGFHGIDERISIESYSTAIWFFENLMRTAN